MSWQGLNDISCRPQNYGSPYGTIPIPNDLAALTNRENRAFRPRFANDVNPRDGIPDDNNLDGVPDYYPTLYFDGKGNSYKDPSSGDPIWSPNTKTLEQIGYGGTGRQNQSSVAGATSLYAFPFIYPGMYSVPKTARAASGYGWIHETYPATVASKLVPNQGPLDFNDNLPNPTGNQTWWGFPTWRETMAGASSGNGAGWLDPIAYVASSTGYLQPNGLQPILATTLPTANSNNLLPPLYLLGTAQSPPFFDGTGSVSFVANPATAKSAQPAYPSHIWEDDLLQTGVRSFDIKAYDPDAPLYNVPIVGTPATNGPFSSGYHDLGYGSTGLGGVDGTGGYIAGPGVDGSGNQVAVPWQGFGSEPQGFGHEGRVPPLPGDFRYHPRKYGYNVGDATAAVQRLTRVWDSWSTDYANAPDSDIFLNGYGSNVPSIYPSFAAPYPSPLRGIQIQIRITDPRNQKVKSITIRHDFTDKL